MILENALNIYVDGSSLPKPRRGGVGVRFITIDSGGSEVIEELNLPGYPGATNNEMELQACVIALKEAQRKFNITIFDRVLINSDSKYVVDHVPYAKYQWPKNRWANRDGKPIDNAEIWKSLIREVRRVNKRIDFCKVKGHSKDPHNKAVDKLAKQSAKNSYSKPISYSSVRRKKTNQSVSTGCVRMKGQDVNIRVITTKYLKTQKIYKYRYEVISKDSEFHDMVDFIFSKIFIKDGHCYFVRFCNNQKFPTLLKVYGECDYETGDILSD